jgi:hypothetical protein
MHETRHLPAAVLVLFASACGATASAGSSATPVKEPAKIAVTASPDPAQAGAESLVTVRLTPVAGIKINKYPKIQLKVAELSGVVAAASASVGSSEPPPPDQIESNYFKSVDPVELKLRISPSASAGRHEVPAQLTYYYCVAASGYCAPAKVPVTIPITVR